MGVASPAHRKRFSGRDLSHSVVVELKPALTLDLGPNVGVVVAAILGAPVDQDGEQLVEVVPSLQLSRLGHDSIDI